MQLAQLVDMELQLLADEQADDEALWRRDRAIGKDLLEYPGEKLAPQRDHDFRVWLFGRWLEQVGDESASVGNRLVAGGRLLAAALSIFGLCFGWLTATAVLAYDGQIPINVFHFLAVFVAAQIALLGLLCLTMLPKNIRELMPFVTAGQDLVRQLLVLTTRAVSRLLDHGQIDTGTWSSTLGQLRARRDHTLFLERWVLVMLTQVFAVCFNVGALCSSLYQVTFSDLAFAWSTTLQWTDTFFHNLVTALASPWQSWLATATPSLRLVELTRYSRLDQAYVHHEHGARTLDPQLLGQWWPFLIAALVTYGLLPRLLLLALSLWRKRVALRGVRLDAARFDRLFERLTAVTVHTQGSGVEAAEDRLAGHAEQRHPLPDRDGQAQLVLWADIPIEAGVAGGLIANRFGWTTSRALLAGGLDGEADSLCAEALARAEHSQPVVVVAEGWQRPTKAIVRLLRTLHAGDLAQRPVVVALTAFDEAKDAWCQASKEDTQCWRDVLATLADPYLRVEVVGEVRYD